MINKFIWYFYTPQQLNYPDLKFSDITRMFYLATHIDYDNNLKYNQKRYMTIQDFESVLNLHQREIRRFYKIIKDNVIISSNKDNININKDIFYKGIIKVKSKLLSEKKCMKINIEEIRFLYEHCIDNRKHKLLGYIFNLIPYCTGNENTITVLDKPATWVDIFNVLNYKSKEAKTMINNLSSLKLSNGENVFLQNSNNIMINTNFISNERNNNNIEIDLESIQDMVNKIRNNNVDENINIYLIQITNTNYYKIGCTSDLNNRLVCLQTSNPLPLELIHSFTGGYKVEYYLQKIFQAYNMNNEWFELPENYVELIKQIK